MVLIVVFFFFRPSNDSYGYDDGRNIFVLANVKMIHIKLPDETIVSYVTENKLNNFVS